jgi:Subtilase family
MTSQWTPSARLRVDPYLNWYARQKMGKGPVDLVTWCLIRIELPAEGTKATLEALELGLKARRMPDDPVELGPTILVSNEENERVIKLNSLSTFDDLPAPVRQFYVYRPEFLVYNVGTFRKSPFFLILQAGPPIPDSVFSPKRTISRAPIFPPRLMEATNEVAIGIIDDGIGFVNERFQTIGKKTRVQRIWLQDIGQANMTNSVAVGSILTKQEIDAKMHAHKGSEQDFYAEHAGARYGGSEHKPLAFRRSHGTFCLDIAAGADPKQDVKERPIFAVQLPADVVADSSGASVASYVLQGVQQIISWADSYKPGIPLIINFSYGILAGPKDGSHQIERALKALVDARKAETIIVLAAGNSYNSRTSARLNIPAKSASAREWVILPDDGTPSFVEIWLDGDAALANTTSIAITLTPPGITVAEEFALDSGQDLLLIEGGEPIAGISVDHKLGASGNRTRVVLSIAATAGLDSLAISPHGRWTIGIHNRTDADLMARLYVQRDNTPAGYPRRGRQSHLDDPNAYEQDRSTGVYNDPRNSSIDTTDTLSAIATGPGMIVVGAAATTPRKQDFKTADYTASGPSRDRQAPDFSAFADIGAGRSGILASGTYSGSVLAMNGTSVSAPQIVRFLADQLGASAQIAAFGDLNAASPDFMAVTDPDHQKRLGPRVLKSNPTAMRDKLRY